MLEAAIVSYSHPEGDRQFTDTKFRILPGGITCLLGLSGAGKSTLLRLVLGVAAGQLDGSISYTSAGGSVLSPATARSLGLVGALAQRPPLAPWLSVRQNLLTPARLNPNLQAPSDAQMITALQDLGLTPSSLSKRVRELSGGMQQRICIARTLLYTPSFLLLDEVFSALDSWSAAIVAQTIQDYVVKNAATCLLVTHNIDLALELATTLYHLSPDGQLNQVVLPATRGTLIEALERDSTLNGQQA